MSQFDPSRRLYLAGLPAEVTRKEIVDFVKKRTRANPMYVEIAKGKDGKCKGYAHATVEGLRSVVEALNGVPMGGNRITAEVAKPHFSVPIMAAKKAREDEEQAAAEARMTARMEQREQDKAKKAEMKALVKEVLEAPSDDDEDPYAGVKCHRAESAEGTPAAAVFAGSKLKFAAVATQVADKLREEHRERVGSSQGYDQQQGGYQQGGYQQQSGYHQGGYDDGAAYGRGRGRGGDRGGFRGRGGRGGAAPEGEDRRVKFSNKPPPSAVPAEPAAPPPPPEPTKEAKKLANLQAKLAALKSKLGK